jgi:hypothetical protein
VSNKELEAILDDCLERLLVRGETIEDCLAAYSKQADALKPLLQTTLAVRKAAAIQPSPEFRARARYQFRVALRERAVQKSHLFPSWRLHWATALTAILAMLLAGGGLVAAANSSMPDNPLYSLKLAAEQLQLSLTPSELDKANLYAEFADRRVAEIIYIAQKGDASLADAATRRLNNQLAMIASLAIGQGSGSRLLNEAGQAPSAETKTQTQPGASLSTTPPLPAPTLVLPQGSTADFGPPESYPEDEAMSQLMQLLLQDANQNIAALRDLWATAPEAVKPAVLQAISVLETGYTNALNAIGE